MNPENKYIIDQLEHVPVPLPSDSYFEELKKNVLSEIKNDLPIAIGTKKSEKPRIIPMYRRWYVWGSAAAILAFALLFPWNNTHSPTASEPINLSSVSNEEIYDYLDENIEDLDAETIALHLNNDGISAFLGQEAGKTPSETENTETFTARSPLLEEVKDEEILDYLEEESGELDEYLLIES